MFDYERTLSTLGEFRDLSERKKYKFLKKLFYDETFMEWLFQPKQVPNLHEMVSALYVEFTRPRTIRAIVDMIDEEGCREFTRSHATFLYSICNIAIQSNNERIEETNMKRKSGEISNKEAERLNIKMEKYSGYIADLLKTSRKIIKKNAVSLSRESRLPRYICITAMQAVPEVKYIDRFKIGYYLNNLLNNVYSEVEQLGDFSNTVRWKPFFREIFGKDNVVEVATFILLEGVNRIDKYRNSEDVKAAWDSLTSFALGELNEAPEQIRSKMIELYIKRIDKMFSNKAYDLRVNLLSINDEYFPKLVGTIEKYADKIESILKRGKA